LPFIARNNELRQEFHYAHYKTKIQINNIYNTSFYGAPLWDFSSRNFVKLEKTWNTSARLILDLLRNTHRYFIEPLTETHHVIKSLWNRFLNFVSNISNGKKKALRRVLDLVKEDVRSTTGKNLRHLRMKTVNFNEKELDVYKDPYKPIPSNDTWRISMVKEIMGIRCGDRSTNLSKKEVDDLADYVCGM